MEKSVPIPKTLLKPVKPQKSNMLIRQKATANHVKIFTFASWTAWASSTLVLSSRPACKQSRKDNIYKSSMTNHQGSRLPRPDTVDGEGLHGKQKSR